MKLEIPSAMDFIKKLQADVRSKPFKTIEEAQAQNILSEMWCAEIIEALEKAEKYKWHTEDLPDTNRFVEIAWQGDKTIYYEIAYYRKECKNFNIGLPRRKEIGSAFGQVIGWKEIEPFEEVRE